MTAIAIPCAVVLWICACASTAKKGIGKLNCPLCWMTRGSIWPKS